MIYFLSHRTRIWHGMVWKSPSKISIFEALKSARPFLTRKTKVSFLLFIITLLLLSQIRVERCIGCRSVASEMGLSVLENKSDEMPLVTAMASDDP